MGSPFKSPTSRSFSLIPSDASHWAARRNSSAHAEKSFQLHPGNIVGEGVLRKAVEEPCEEVFGVFLHPFQAWDMDDLNQYI